MKQILVEFFIFTLFIDNNDGWLVDTNYYVIWPCLLNCYMFCPIQWLSQYVCLIYHFFFTIFILFVERKYFYLFLVKHTCVSWRRGRNLFGLRGYTRAYKEFPWLQLTAITLSYCLSRFWWEDIYLFKVYLFFCSWGILVKKL